MESIVLKYLRSTEICIYVQMNKKLRELIERTVTCIVI